MGCPVHIWVPLMASMAPFARVARDRFRGLRPTRRGLRFTGSDDAPATSEAEAPVIKRWAPVQPASSSAARQYDAS